MAEPNRAVTTYDAVRTSSIIGPTVVTGALTALDDVIVRDQYFVPEDAVDDVFAVQPRVVPIDPDDPTSDVRTELVFGRADVAGGTVEPRVIFSSPDLIDPTNSALCIPGFSLQTGGIPIADLVGLVAYDVDGCFHPATFTDVVGIVCDDLIADPECIDALTTAIVTNLNALPPTDPTAVLFCETVETCVIESLVDVVEDDTTPFGVAFCNAVEACLPGADIPAILQCTSLDLDVLQYTTEVQAPCVSPDVGVLAVPPSTDYTNAAFFSVYGQTDSAAIPGGTISIVSITAPITIITTAVPPTITVLPTATVIDTTLTTALTTPVYVFDTTLDASYNTKVRLTSKGPPDTADIVFSFTQIPISITVDIDPPIVATVLVPNVIVPIADIGTAVEATYLLNNVADVVSPVEMNQFGASTIDEAAIEIAIIDAVEMALIGASGLFPIIPGVTATQIINAIILALTPILTTAFTDFVLFNPVITAVGDVDGTVTFDLVGAAPLSSITVRAENVRTPLIPEETVVQTLSARVPKQSPSVYNIYPRATEAKKQVRILPKLVSKK